MEPPPPPARLSTITGLPMIFSSASATGRAARSAWPPAGNGTIMVMLREGQGVCAKAACESAVSANDKAAAAFNNSRRFIGWFLPGGFVLFVDATWGDTQ